MRSVIEEVFTEVLEYLIERGYVKVENYFLDGTKIEANANRYSLSGGRAQKTTRRNWKKKYAK